MSTAPPTPAWWPTLEGKIHPDAALAIKLLYDAQQQQNDALVTVHNNVTTAVTTVMQAAAATPTFIPPVPPQPSNLGGVNNQTGTTYSLQNSDYGGIVTLNNASAVAVTLNSLVQQFWFGALENLGAGLVTLTPSSGLINGGASIPLFSGMGCWLFFDGTNWWAVTSLNVPIATATVFGIVKPDNSTVTISGGVLSAVGGGSGPTITTNANGTAAAFGAAWVHQFGQAGPSATGVPQTFFNVTFPVAFAGIPRVVCQPVNDPDTAFGTAVYSCYPTNITTTGFLANLACGVTIGGGGPPNITNPTFVDWMADFA